MSVEKQVAIIWAGYNGHLNDIELDDVKRFEEEFLSYLGINYASTLDDIRDSGELNDEIVQNLTDAVNEFKKGFTV